MIKEAIEKMINQQNLTFAESQAVLNEIMTGQVSDIQIASLLTGLTIKNPTPDEIAGAASAMRHQALAFPKVDGVLEIVGTGGDHSNSFNISSTSAIVVSAAGVKVAKHGNRAASSKSGAADVLEALGININQSPEVGYQSLADNNFCFLFAQEYHKSMRFVAPVRKALGFRTIFNILGPLANPAHPQMQLFGVYDANLLEPMAEVLHKLGVVRAMIVHSEDGLDELTTTAANQVVELNQGKITHYSLTPEELGFKRAKHEDLVGGTPAENAAITREILKNVQSPRLDAVLLNAGAALHLAKPELTIAQGIDLARQTIATGKAEAQLTKLVNFSQNAEDVVA
ncbi:MAG: anthranilate phosphoribosyltransferase [Lactobacillus sp.]|jgi:anthranilate phosphoribosyltransferase|nr:anthranilate phosphoribosyltransferase [Lactobacillus sp.]